MERNTSMTTEKIKELAKNARLSLTDTECELFSRDIAALEAMCAPLFTLSVDFTEKYRARGMNTLREDTVGECLETETVRSMAPAWEDGYIPVPRAVEGGDE